MPFRTLTVSLLALLPTAALADWNGPYAGASFSSVSNLSYDNTNNTDVDVDFEDTSSFSAFFGGHGDSGNFVLGYEIALEIPDDASVDVLADTASIDTILDLKLAAGVPAGNALVYGIVGISSISGNYGFLNEINASGFSFGAGAAFKLTEQFSISGEYLSRTATQEFIGTNIDAAADSLSLRAAFHF